MKTKLIKLSNEHYIVVDDSEIKENTNTFKEGLNGDWFYNSIYKQIANIGDITPYDFKITHSTQPLEKDTTYSGSPERPVLGFWEIGQLTIPEVEEAIYGYSYEKLKEIEVHKIVKELDIKDISTPLFLKIGYNIGFNAHKELVKDKLSVNQVIDFYKWLKKSYGFIKPLEEAQIRHRTTPDKILEMYLQTLKEQTEWNVEIIDGKIKLL